MVKRRWNINTVPTSTGHMVGVVLEVPADAPRSLRPSRFEVVAPPTPVREPRKVSRMARVIDWIVAD